MRKKQVEYEKIEKHEEIMNTMKDIRNGYNENEECEEYEGIVRNWDHEYSFDNIIQLDVLHKRLQVTI